MKRWIALLILISLFGSTVYFWDSFNALRIAEKNNIPVQDQEVALAQSASSVSKAPPSNESMMRVIGGVDESGVLICDDEGKPQVQDVPNEPHFVREVLSESWLDAKNKAGRRRVRIVDADFKYSRIRLEEEVWTHPDTGEQEVTRTRASVADHVMVGLKKGVDHDAAQQFLVDQGYRIRATEPGSYLLVELAEFNTSDAQQVAIDTIAGMDEWFAYAEPDYLVYSNALPNDPDFTDGKLWGLHNPGSIGRAIADADIDAPEAWSIRHDASDIVVAVLDSGIKYTHPDLVDNMWTHETTGHFGYDAYDNDDDPNDSTTHGTHCAGIIGAVGDNRRGVTGVAWDVQLMAGRFMGSNGGTVSDAIRVINYARENGADVITSSWGGTGYSQALYDAIEACGTAGIPFVAAAGNDSRNNDATPYYPAGFDLPVVISVAASTVKDELSVQSSYGRYSVDLAAPGVDILSCNTGAFYIGSEYVYHSGSSMAASYVSGAMALAKAHFPDDDVNTLIARLYASVDGVPGLAGRVNTGGRLNVYKLLKSSSSWLSHDDFENALQLDGAYGYWSGSNQEASREVDEDGFSLPGTGNRSLWFSWTAPDDGVVKLTVQSDLNGFRLVVFEGAAKGGLSVASDAGAVSGNSQTMSFDAEAGRDYRFLIDSSHATGQKISFIMELQPGNDDIVNAAEVVGDRFTDSAITRGATAESFELAAPHGGVAKWKSVWWKWTPDFDGEMVVTTQGSEFDTVLAVYSGSVENLVEVAFNDDRSSLDRASQVALNVSRGTTYFIAVDSYLQNEWGKVYLNGFRRDQMAIVRHPSDVSVVLPGRVVFDVVVAALGSVQYQWLLDGVEIAGEVQDTLVIDPASQSDIGEYRVRVRYNSQEVMSDAARIIEAEIAPIIEWVEKDQSVAEGRAASFAVLARGVGVLRYQWYKDGVVLDGETSSGLGLNQVLPSDAGLYRVDVLNDHGKVSAEMSLSVMDAIWNSWEWVRPEVPHNQITDIKAYNDEVYAVAGDSLLHSPDGQTWSESKFPHGFFGGKFEMSGDLRVCLGKDVEGEFKVAVSLSGEPWTVSKITGSEDWLSEKCELFETAGVFVVQSPIYSSDGTSSIAYSRDGVHWEAARAIDASGQISDFSARGTISSGGDRLMVGGPVVDHESSKQLVYYDSSDGVHWYEHMTQADGTGSALKQAAHGCYSSGKYHLISPGSVLSSEDGTHWSYQSLGNTYSQYDKIVRGGGGMTYMLNRLGMKLEWFDSPDQIQSRSKTQNSAEVFTSAAVYRGALIYGTNAGNIKSVIDPYDVQAEYQWMTNSGFTVGFFNDQFFTRSLTSSASLGDLSLVSGDGTTWNYTNKGLNASDSYIGYAMGLHWGGALSLYSNVTGYTPWSLGDDPPDYDGLDRELYWIGENPSGDVLAITSYRDFLIKSAGSDIFVPGTFPVSGGGLTEVNGRWYTSEYVRGEVHTSLDGLTWSASGFSGDYVEVMEKDGVVYAALSYFDGSDIKIVKTTDGVSWQAVDIKGLSSGVLQQLVIFNGDFIAQVGSSLYWSSDGVTWVRLGVPATVKSVAVGNGQLLISSAMGILRVGSDHAGGLAPVVRITTPQAETLHVLGSNILVQGDLNDAEDGAVTYACFVDGQLVESGEGSGFSFKFRSADISGHTIYVEATDQFGLKGSDIIKVGSATPAVENRLSEEGLAGSLPTLTAVGLGGAYYVADKDSLYRSDDGGNWSQVHLPVLGSEIRTMVSGNGALLLQLVDGRILSTRNGNDWVFFSPDGKYVGTPALSFKSGVFIAPYTLPASSTRSYMISKDGQHWTLPGSEKVAYDSVNWFLKGEGEDYVGAGSDGKLYQSKDAHHWKLIHDVNDSASLYLGGIYADERWVIVDLKNRNVAVSEDGVAWRRIEVPELAYSTEASIVYCGGRYYIGSGYWAYLTSLDGVTWVRTSSTISSRRLVCRQGVYTTVTYQGVAWSLDGVSWTLVASGLGPVGVVHLVDGLGGVLAIDGAGAAWISEDGMSWEPTYPLGPGGPDEGVVLGLSKEIESLNGRLILAGDHGLFFSDDDGDLWQPCTVTGLPDGDPGDFVKLTAGGTVVLASTLDGKLFISSDGLNWNIVADAASIQIMDFDFNGSVWRAIGKTGEVIESSDDGVTWGDVVPGVFQKGASILWFNSSWMVVGGMSTGNYTRNYIYKLNALDEIVAQMNLNSWSFESLQTLAAHNKLMILGGSYWWVSSDGENWTRLYKPSGVNNGTGIEVYTTSSGFRALYDMSNDLRMFEIEADETRWRLIPTYYAHVEQADNVGTSSFIFGPERIYEEVDNDLALEVTPSSMPVLGVEDQWSFEATIQNLSNNQPSAEGWVIDAWISSNAVVGGDVYLGQFTVDGGMPTGGAQLSKTMTTQLPPDVLAGDHYVVLKLSNQSGQRESNITNNVAMSDMPQLRIPGWELNVLTQGGGEVIRDRMLALYPHKSSVSLTAVPSDGWELRSWQGAVTGSDSHVQLLMESSQEVTAQFVLPVTNWKAQKFSVDDLADPMVSGDSADPDKDGLKNWQEYLHGSGPMDAASTGLIRWGVSDGWLYAVYTRNQGVEGAYSLSCQATRDMGDWDVPDRQERILTTENGIETVETKIPVSGGAHGFLRLKYDH